MTDSNSTSNSSNKEPIFKEFKWHRDELEKASIPGYSYATLAGSIRDVASGCETIMRLVEDDWLRVNNDETRLLNDTAIGDLMRLAIHSLSELNNSACSSLEWAYDYHTTEGKAKRVARENYEPKGE